ncbi:hypothetical protein ACX12E_20895 [Paenibacillus vandeheii]
MDGYSIDQLRFKSQEDVWSIGQMYIHVIDVAEEYIDHIQTCTMATQEKHGGKTEDGTKAFIEKAWPDVRVKLEDPYQACKVRHGWFGWLNALE